MFFVEADLQVRLKRCAKIDFRPAQAGVAQLAEQLIRNQQVVGSSPTAGSIFSNKSVVT